MGFYGIALESIQRLGGEPVREGSLNDVERQIDRHVIQHQRDQNLVGVEARLEHRRHVGGQAPGSDPGSDVEVVTWRAKVSCRLPRRIRCMSRRSLRAESGSPFPCR